MDKAEYISKLEQINALQEAGSYQEAAEIADSIDWKHVKSVRTLCMVGEIYEANRRYEDSRRIMKMAYRRSSSSKTVLYRLAELDIVTGNIDEAKKFINEFEQNSPNDTSRFILKYKLLKAENAPIDDQIAVLREYQNHEYTERWSYELARLYKKNGQNEKCIEECDDLILWFSEGRYVTKALELKKQLGALTPAQQAKYEASLKKEAEEKARAKEAAAELAKAAREKKAAEAEAKEASPADEPQSDDGSGAEEEAPHTGAAGGEAAEEAASGESAESSEEAAGEGAAEEAAPEEPAAEEESADGDEDLPGLSSEEAIEKMDSAAGRTFGDKNVLELQEANSGGRESGEKFQSRLASGIRAVFASIRQTASVDTGEPEEEEDDRDDDMKIAGEPGSGPSEYLAEIDGADGGEEKPVVRDLEPESTDAGSVVRRLADVFGGKRGNAKPKARTEEEIAGEEIDAALKKDERPRAVNLDDLFAETAGMLASEVASGNYQMADTLETDSAEGEARLPESPAEFAEQVRAAVARDAQKDGAGAADAVLSDNAEEPAAENTAAPAEPDVSRGEAQEDNIESIAEAVRMAAEQAVRDAAEEASAEESGEAAAETAAETPAEEGAAEAGDAFGEVPAEEDDGGAFSGMPEEEAAPEQNEIQEEDTGVTGRETDESLGLTREFHFQNEIEKALAERRARKDSEEPGSIPSPEEAAEEQVTEAVGGIPAPVPEESGSAGEFEIPPLAAVFAEGDNSDDMGSDEALIERYGAREEGAAAAAVPEEREAGAESGSAGTEELLLRNDSDRSDSDVLELLPTEGRQFTAAEARAFSYFASVPGMDYQATAAIADINNHSGDRTSRSGNVAITGRPGSGKTRLAEALILTSCLTMGLKAVRTGKIVSDVFNSKDPAAVVKTLAGGFLIIEAAGALSSEAVERLNKAMEFRTDSLVVILEDEKQDLEKLFAAHPSFAAKFTNHISVPIFTNDELVSFGKVYAEETGYKMDEMATLALYTMIGDNQKNAEPVTVGMVRDMVDKAADRNSRKFRFGKAPERENGLIVLHEKDFNF